MTTIGAASLSDRQSASPRSLSWHILLVSMAGLLLEMMLIRWIGTEIRIFAYLQNTVLIVCFLGLGIGCFSSRSPVRMGRALAALLALTALLSLPGLRQIAAKITEYLSVLGDLVIWQQAVSDSPAQTIGQVTLGLVMTLGIMILLWEIFLPLGRILGRAMDDHPRTIQAYSINVLGSLLGIWLFVLLSALHTPPIVWLAIAAALLVRFIWGQQERWLNAALLATVVAVGAFAGRDPGARQVVWSPYQKLTFMPPLPNGAWAGTQIILVNNTGYQAIFDLDEQSVRNNPRIPEDLVGLSQYDIPLLLHPHPDKVLIVGAGSGNDVAGALRGGAQQVTAVEIDPAIIQLGRHHHPEGPYQSDRVQVVTDDARSYFARTDERFDLIIFGLLDSHTTTAMTNARLDHYVYTRESLERARSLLADGGVMVLSFEAAKPFIADRMHRCISQVFGESPLAFRIPPNPTGWGGTLFVTGNTQGVNRQLAGNPRLAQKIEQWQEQYPLPLTGSTPVTTDDWPYIYLKGPSIPTLYFLLALLLVALVGYGRLRLGPPRVARRWGSAEWHFFLLGAGFLLLEVQNISKASVVIGNTWLVNAVIVSGILVMILLANAIKSRWSVPASAVAVCLIGSCLALYWLDLSTFAFLPFIPKALLVGTLTTLPMLFSGIIFIESLTEADDKDRALGANLLGALVGGIVQTITFVTGVRALLLVVAGLYAAALILRPDGRPRAAHGGRERRRESPEAEPQRGEPLPV